MAAGAAVGGPVGAAVGAGVGAAGGAYGEQAVEEAREATQSQTQMEQSAAAQPARMSREEIRQAQRVLQERGYYRGQIDGIVGPRTREAVAQYQRRQGLPQTAQLDGRTVDSLMQEQAGLPEEGAHSVNSADRLNCLTPPEVPRVLTGRATRPALPSGASRHEP